MRNISSPIIKGFISTTLGSGGSKVIMVIATFLCSNLLNQSEFGQFSFVRNTLNMILVICGLNYASICTKFTSECTHNTNARSRLLLVFVFSVILCAIVGVGVYFAPDKLLLQWFKDADIIYFFRITAILLPIFIVNPLAEGVLRGLFQFKLIGFLQTVTSLLFVVMLYCGIRYWGLSGAVYALIGYYLLGSAVMIMSVIKYHPLAFLQRHLKHIHKEAKILVTIIGPIFITSFIEAPVFWFAQIILVKYGNYENVGSMAAIMQIRNLAILLPSYFFSTFIAFAGAMNSEKRFKEYYDKFAAIQKQILIWGGVLCVGLILSGQLILRFYGEVYVDDYIPYIVACIGLPLLLLSNLNRVSLVLQERQCQLMVISVIWNVCWLSALYFFLDVYPISPLMAFFVSQLFGCLIQYIGIKYVFNKDRRNLLCLI